jgi:hypothetical protein
MTSTQVAKLQYLIRSASANIDLKLSVPMILTLATEMSAIIENEGLVLCWMSDFETQLEAKDATK